VKVIRSVRIQFIPQWKHIVSATESNRLMLFGETVAVYCENQTNHINALCEGRTHSSCSVKAAGTHSYQRVWFVLVQEEIATTRGYAKNSS
jgi:hypothetical protein